MKRSRTRGIRYLGGNLGALAPTPPEPVTPELAGREIANLEIITGAVESLIQTLEQLIERTRRNAHPLVDAPLKELSVKLEVLYRDAGAARNKGRHILMHAAQDQLEANRAACQVPPPTKIDDRPTPTRHDPTLRTKSGQPLHPKRK